MTIRISIALAMGTATATVATAAHAEPLPELDPDDAVATIIEDLQPGEAVRLPDFTVIGDGLDAFETFATRGPGIRDFCDKWVWAEDRGRAMYAGGNHGVPHKFNDLWEYDLPSNTWVMLHAPDPGVSPSHTWWGFTYDPVRSQVLWISASSIWDTGGYEGPPLRVYDTVAQNGWSLLETEPPINAPVASALEYIPNRDLFVFYSNRWNGSGMHTLDPLTNAWTELIPQPDLYFDNPDAPPGESIIAYNSVNDVLVGFLGRSVYVYGFDDNEWVRVLDDAGDDTVNISDSQSGSDYDPYSDLHYVQTQGRLFAYDVQTNTFEDLEVELAPDFAMTYFDRGLGVVVLYDETSSHVVYRHAALPEPGDDDDDDGDDDDDDAGDSTGNGDGGAAGDASTGSLPADDDGGVSTGDEDDDAETSSDGSTAGQETSDEAGCSCRSGSPAAACLLPLLILAGSRPRRRAGPGCRRQ